MPAKLTTIEINNRLLSNRGQEYILAEESKGVKSKTLIKHLVCGQVWLVIPNDVINRKSSCPYCSNHNKHRTLEDVQNLLNASKGFEDYLLVKFNGMKIKSTIKHSCGHTWDTLPYDIIKNKSHCPKCTIKNSGFNFNKPSILYFFSFEVNSNLHYYKLGITNRTVKERHCKDWSIIEPIWELHLIGTLAFKLEKLLLERYKEYKINTGVLLSGNTETLSKYISKEEALRELEILENK